MIVVDTNVVAYLYLESEFTGRAEAQLRRDAEWAVLELVRQSDCSAYGCEFAALALQLGVPRVTMDGKLLEAFPKFATPLPVAAG